MPMFDFKCQECGHIFDLIISYANKDQAKCPQCGADNPQQLLSSFSTPRVGNSEPRAGNPIGGCAACGLAGSGGCGMRF